MSDQFAHGKSNELAPDYDASAEAAIVVEGDSSPQEIELNSTDLFAAGPKKKDRIVVLGRTQAGKTIFLSCLYHKLWSNPKAISIRALDGATHRECIQTMQTLREGKFPSSTQGSRYMHMNVTYMDHTRPLISLDYPGEVFRKAFIDGDSTEDVIELLGHIDRAAAVIALVDPAVIESHDLTKSMDDDFGMLQALERIRNWPGGENIPVALVLTKYDLRRPMIKAAGGPAKFVRTRFPQLAQSFGDAKVFVASAIQFLDGKHAEADGARVNPHFESHGLEEPLRYLLHHIDSVEKYENEVEQREATRKHVEQMKIQAEKERVWKLFMWAGFWVLVTAVTALAMFIAWWMGSK